MTELDYYMSERYDWNHLSAVSWISKTESIQERRIWWSVGSKAGDRSRNRRTEMSWSKADRMSFTRHNKTVSVLWPAPQADWKVLQMLFSISDNQRWSPTIHLWTKSWKSERQNATQDKPTWSLFLKRARTRALFYTKMALPRVLV